VAGSIGGFPFVEVPMRSVPTAVLLFLPIVACAAPREHVATLPLRCAFATDYTGGIDLASEANPAFDWTHDGTNSGTSPAPSGEVATVRSWLVQVPLAEARLLLSDSGNIAAFGLGHLVDRAALLDRLDGWYQRGAVRSEPFATVDVGTTNTLRVTHRVAAITSYDWRRAGGTMALDPRIRHYEYGTAIDVRPWREGEALMLTVEWQQVDALRERAVAALDGQLQGSVAVPVLARQRITGTTKLAGDDAVVFAMVEPTTPDSALLLFVDARTGAPALADAY